ncbi:MAG TPA: pantoate--beta-alanine ligase [Desulfatiglandales bacterium]|nr:pantoate--beta-alanine ligase [Desulfatiglandales bacterium]
MDVSSSIADIRRWRWAEPLAVWGFVPTMGFLHEGHLSLVRKARQENDRVSVSIFVNPIQFNDPNDLAAYPYDIDRDLNMLKEIGVDLVWTPTPDIVYPNSYETFVDVEKVTQRLEGAARPGFFRGVTTVVAKLFNVFQPHRTYFGQKDAQQAIVIKRMVEDLNFNIEVIVCPTIREADGLAMSSRNTRLSPTARQKATCLYHALCAARDLFEQGERDAERLKSTMTRTIESTDTARLDYVSVAHPDTLEELKVIQDRALLSLAVFLDEVRLIDNIILEK